MAFPLQAPRNFTKAGVEALDPNQHGVYGIYHAKAWVYVGRGDIRTRLLSHVGGDNPRIIKENPTHFVAEVTKNEEVREKQLIVELNPIANQKVG